MTLKNSKDERIIEYVKERYPWINNRVQVVKNDNSGKYFQSYTTLTCYPYDREWPYEKALHGTFTGG